MLSNIINNVWLETTHIYYLTVPVDQEFGCSLVASGKQKGIIKVLAGAAV